MLEGAVSSSSRRHVVNARRVSGSSIPSLEARAFLSSGERARILLAAASLAGEPGGSPGNRRTRPVIVLVSSVQPRYTPGKYLVWIYPLRVWIDRVGSNEYFSKCHFLLW